MRRVRSLLLDALALGGFGCLVFGVHQVYPPAAFIVGGLVTAAGAGLYAWARATDTRPR